MTSRVAVLLGIAFLATSLSTGCSMLVPGNEGFECKTSKDCNDNLRCRTYRFKGRDKTGRHCTGRKALTSSNETYGWPLIIGAWFVILGLPLLVVILVIIAKIKQAKEGPPPARNQGGAAAASQPPPDNNSTPPAD